MQPNIVAIVTARQSSKRLPDKAMADINGVPLIGRIVERLKKSEQINKIVVATDDISPKIVSYCNENDIVVFTGSRYDVLDRLCNAAFVYEADIIVRVWGDSPLIDHRLIDTALKEFLKLVPPSSNTNQTMPDYAYIAGFPDGLKFSIINFASLRDIIPQMSVTDVAIWNKLDENLIWRVLWRTVMVFRSNTDFSHIKLSVDTTEDLELVRSIYAGEGDD